MAYGGAIRVSPVSSWMASLFLGRIAPIEISDASGMNLMDVPTLKGNDELLSACGGPELRTKIGDEPVRVLGKISPWWVQKWGFNEGLILLVVALSLAHESTLASDCIVASFTG